MKSYTLRPDTFTLELSFTLSGTPLFAAAWRGHDACVALLVGHQPQVDVNAANVRGNGPLRAAAYQGNLECVRLLLGAAGEFEEHL